MQCSLLLARTLEHALASVAKWKWNVVDSLHVGEFSRPDRIRERIRFLPDLPGTLQNHGIGTRIYLGKEWELRNDALQLFQLTEARVFKIEDPEMPPPRRRAPRNEGLAEARKLLERLERSR